MLAVQKEVTPAGEASVTSDRGTIKSEAARAASRNAQAAWEWTLSVRAVPCHRVLQFDYHDRAVIVALGASADPRGRAWLSVRRLQRRTGLSESRVELALRRLRRHVYAWDVAPGGSFPDGALCKSGGVVYELGELLAAGLDEVAIRREKKRASGSILGAFDTRLRVSCVARLVLAMIMRHSDDKGRAWPSVPLLVELTGASRSWVLEALKELERARLIRTERIAPGGLFPHGRPAPLGGAVRWVAPPLSKCTTPPRAVDRGALRGGLEAVFDVASEQERTPREDVGDVVAHFGRVFGVSVISSSWEGMTRERLKEGFSSTELCATIDAARSDLSRQGKPWLRTYKAILGTADAVLGCGAIRARHASSTPSTTVPSSTSSPATSSRPTSDQVALARVRLGFVRAVDAVDLPPISDEL